MRRRLCGLCLGLSTGPAFACPDLSAVDYDPLEIYRNAYTSEYDAEPAVRLYRTAGFVYFKEPGTGAFPETRVQYR